MKEISNKIKQVFPDLSVLKNPDNYSVFNGRNLPSFVKDYLIKKFVNTEGELDNIGITRFLNEHIPAKGSDVKSMLRTDRITLNLLTRFTVTTDIKKNKLRFSIPDLGIAGNDGLIPDYVAEQNKDEFRDGEKWGVIKLVYQPPMGKEPGYVELAGYKPFRPYRVDLDYFRECRSKFTTEEWIDVLLSAMEYDPDGFDTLDQKVEFLSRLLVFVEPRLNMIELAPKGTGKSYVFGSLSKYGWLCSGGKVTRAKLFYDKTKKQPGIFRNYDFVTFDEIQTIVFQEPAEIQAALKSYLESGKTTIDNYEFMSESGMMIMGNIPLTKDNLPVNEQYLTTLPEDFQESALLDRFHGFIEGWKLPRMRKDLILNDWTLNVEYFTEILHSLRNDGSYSLMVSSLIDTPNDSDLRDLKAIQKLTSAYLKLFFPHWQKIEDVDIDEFRTFCLNPALHKRGIIKSQCHMIDPEFAEEVPLIRVNH